MPYIYITGDRSINPMTSVMIAYQAIANVVEALPAGSVQFITCDSSSGIESAVRYLLPKEMLTVVKRGLDADGHIDFDKTNELIKATADAVLVLHADPLKSRVTQSVARIFDPEIVQYPISAAISSNLMTEGL